MTKWISNSAAVISSIPEHLRATHVENLKIESDKIERVLGLSWSPVNDNFMFTLNLKKIDPEIWQGSKIPTKRDVLRVTMSIFDPLGFLAPIIVKARILMQNIWKSSIDWDSEINETLFKSWKSWVKELQTLMPVNIPRCYFRFATIPFVDLHLFSDASEKAYACVAYIRLELPGVIRTSFVSSKYKVAPLKHQTIPKLELQAAVLALRLSMTIISELEYSFRDVHYWIDSLVVLQQIRSQARRFPAFVSCRLGEIHENSEIKQWHWVPTLENVADLATRDSKPVDLSFDSVWLSGPEFLRSPRDNWPLEPSVCQQEFITPVESTFCQQEEISLVITNKINDVDILPNINRFSKFIRLIRSTALIIYFVKWIMKKTDDPNKIILDVDSIEKANNIWIKKCQQDCFSVELKIIQENKSVPRTNRLFKLSPFLDEDGIIRLNGRILDVNIDFNMKFPIILDSEHKFVEMLIQHFHEEAGHIGFETVVNNIRSKFWVIKLRPAVKRCIQRCQSCRIRKCVPVPPMMGNLPKERTESFVYPFTYVGVDLFGPMTVSIGRRVEKRYGVLFTCLTVRAIHIELAASLDTNSTILALRRFMCRRGQPKEFWSDNGTNFVGAERELREWAKSLDQEQISNYLVSKEIAWKFNCPLASHQGGIWERMIRSVKTALRITLKTVNPKEEVLATLLLEIEYILNLRPLTHISVDPSEPEALTPNHFLLLRSGNINSYPVDTKLDRKHWMNAQLLANLFWQRWVKEYRPTLVPRPKWREKTKPLKVDDLVLIVDEKFPRNQWLMGRVLQVYPGKNDIVRMALIKTKQENYTRPVTKLCILPGLEDVNCNT